MIQAFGMRFWYCFLWVFFSFVFSVSAQEKSVELQEVKVQSSRLDEFGTGTKIKKIDSTELARFKNGTLADLLSQNNLLFIKTYSPGNLATPSFRGTGPAHTAVLWNGFNIQSPMNGQTDFTLLPANFVNNVQVQFGGAGALFGSGAIGGTIHLNNVPTFDRGITAGANATLGSFANYQQNISAEISKKRWITAIKLFNTDNKNNYTFIDPINPDRTQRQVNARVSQKGLLLENYFKLTDRQTINFHYWYQEASRQIPPPLLAGTETQDYQNDVTHRLSSQWQRTGQKVNWAVRSALFSEKILFGRPRNDTAQNTVITFITEVENTITIAQNQSLKLGVNNTFNKAKGDNMPSGNPELNRIAFFGAYKISAFNNNWSVSLTLREQLNNNKSTPLTPGLGLAGNVYKDKLKLTANVSRNYRLPTFNDLYWQAGLAKGNRDLQPESGWSEDFGLALSLKKEKKASVYSLDATANVFNSNINNWIYWYDSSSVLRVDNIQSVWSQGFETSIKLKLERGRFSVFLDANFDYTVSTIEETDSKNASSLGKQLIYVPYNKAFTNIGFRFSGFTAIYNHAFTGFRYSSEDNSSFLSDYQLGNIYASYQQQIKGFQWQVFGKINNIWNESYQVMASRPMPLVNFQFGLSVQFNKPNKPS